MLTDFDIIKQMLPRIPNGKHTRTHIAMGWAALILFPIWLPLAVSYVFFWVLCMLGQAAHEFLLKGAHWLSDTAQERETEAAEAERLKQAERQRENEEWLKKHKEETEET